MAQAYPKQVERWGVFEIALPGRADGNPFTDYEIHGTFTGKNESKTVSGFYDGAGIYKVRFMPSFEGEYRFKIEGSFSGCAEEGTFTATPPTGNNHGPVRVAYTYHLAYEDGTPYFSVGTTCYAFAHQPLERQAQTLHNLEGTFNKLRFCIFPKHYDFNFKDPITFPYEGTPCDNSAMTKENFSAYKPDNPENHWDFHRFNPEHFRIFDQRIQDLMDRGIEADLIVMHPYDRWGFSIMNAEEDDLYWNYIVARFSAYRNVWWSLANEYDLMPAKKLADWERYGSILCERDPYNHLRSIHNCFHFYDYSHPWITHCSIQRIENLEPVTNTAAWRTRYRKPIVVDEMCYEGNIEHGWGNISGRELLYRFWTVTIQGGYAGHGETFVHPDNVLWWSHGGELHGEAPARLRFLYKILSETPGPGLAPCPDERVTAIVEGKNDRAYRLLYFGRQQLCYKRFHFDDNTRYQVELIDTWNMTIEDKGVHSGLFQIDLPGREYMAMRIRKVEE